MNPTARIQLSLLGRFKATVEGTASQSLQISASRQRALLAYLVLQPDYSETRERLATLLWANGSDQQARQNLRQLLLGLRKLLAVGGLDPLRTDRESVALDPDQIAADVRVFETLVRSDDPADLDRALTLYQGDLLDGFSTELESFEPWLQRERARFKALAAMAFDRAVRRHDDESEPNSRRDALRAAEQWVALDRLDEAAQRALIGQLWKASGPTAALAHAESVRVLVRQELDCAPEPGTLALIDAIRAHTELTAMLPTVAAAAVTVSPERATSATSAASTANVTRPMRRPLFAGAASVALLAVLGLGGYLLRPPVDTGTRTAVAPPDVRANIERSVDGRSVTPIVVLPFAAEAGGSAQNAQFARRMSDDLIATLSRVPSFRVIARSTSNQYSDRRHDIAAMGQELGVRYAVEGTVRFADRKIRIDVALVDTATRLQAWSERYEHDEDESQQVHEDIVRGLARQLHVSIMEVRGGSDLHAGGASVRDTLFKAWAALNLFAFVNGGQEAGGLFEDVLRADPDNPSALTGLAAYKVAAVVTRQNTASREQLFEESGELLKKALAANPQASLPYYFLGLRAMAMGQLTEALALYAQALERNPSYAPAYGNAARALFRLGRFDEALEQVLYAMRLSPKDHYMGSWSLTAGQIYVALGNDADAERMLRQSVRVSPNIRMARAALAATLMLRGDESGAIEQIVGLRKLVPAIALNELRKSLAGQSEQEAANSKRMLQGLDRAFSLADARS
jgi:TolB-like protein/DNA-binding SARP family transcriptional activator